MENEILYSWKFNDKKERSQLWYIITLSIVIGLVMWGFLTKQYGMSFLIMLIAGVTYFVENNSEDEVIVNITNLGIKISNTFYDFSKINSYTLIYDGDNAIYLRLILNKKGLKIFNIYIDNTIASNLKEILPNFIEENPKLELSFTEKLINKLKL